MYFTQSILDHLADLCYLDVRQTHQRKLTVHFDKAPINNTKRVPEQMEACGFSRMDHPLYRPDLAPCDFFPFGNRKENVAGKSRDTDGELYRVCELFWRPFLATYSGLLLRNWSGG
jgi:hypothetical protein